jgi:hypothetical protein
VIEPATAAAAIVHAASSPRREYWLGLSTVKILLANMIGPGILDRYLACNAYEAQATEQQVPSWREDNLDRPIPALHRVLVLSAARRRRLCDRFLVQWCE